MFHHSYKIDANFYKSISIERLKMYRHGPAKQPAKQPPTQKHNFMMLMLFAVFQSQSVNMLRLLGFLRTGEELLPMSPESKRLLFANLHAVQHANLSPRQVRGITSRQLQRLKSYGGLHAFLLTKLIGKQSWQPCQISFSIPFLRHFMTMCIPPRILITPNRTPEYPVKSAWQLTGSVVYYDPSGFIYNGKSHDWSKYHHQITNIISHSKLPWIAIMHSNGDVWIGKIDDPFNLFQLIHCPQTDDEKATAIAFHPDGSLIAVAIRAHIIMINISPSLKPVLHFKAWFYESGYYCSKPRFSADKLSWNLSGTLLMASKDEELSMCYFIDTNTNKAIGGFHGGINFGELPLYRGNIFSNMSPSCSCFSVNGNLVMTSYPDGTLVTNIVENTEKGLTLRSLKRTNDVLSEKIDMIASHPCDPSVFAIGMSRGLMHFSVSIVLVNDDGSVTITATIRNAKSPHFYKNWLLVSSGNRILFHKMNRCNIPCLVTEFHLQENGPFSVSIDAFCVITAPDGKIKLYYSLDGKLYTAEITLG